MPNVAIADTAADKRIGLYPPIAPFNQGRLSVSDLHEIYFEEAGNPDGVPVLTVHGGPGGGSSPTMRRFHDPDHYRIILFDQRGCGRSTPHAELTDNTTWHLVDDIERLRIHLGVPKWHLFGGSWGSTLSLAYAQRYPEHVIAMVLRGIFLMRQREVDWFYQNGCNWVYPDAYEAFAAQIAASDRHDMVSAYYARLTADDIDVRLEAARAWSTWEAATLSITENSNRGRLFGSDAFALAFARIECHYFMNKGFFDRDDQLLSGVDSIRHIPTAIVNGRYDMITPLQNAWDLIKVWPEARLRIVPLAGHAMTEPGTIHELISATARFRHLRV
ncbi:MAG: prolyl aminopeptidase [Alphaproteobacteria bacterium]|nr:prolyl aminopeptidase [Alphaproteobacteria bacterium]